MSNIRTGAEPQIPDADMQRPKWRTPMLTEDAISDVTMNVSTAPGSDGYDATFPASGAS